MPRGTVLLSNCLPITVAEYLDTLIYATVIDRVRGTLATLGQPGRFQCKWGSDGGFPGRDSPVRRRDVGVLYRKKAILCKLPLTFKVMAYHLLSK